MSTVQKPYYLIEGTYHVVGYSPDGDSIQFRAKKKKNWDLLPRDPKLNQRDHTRLRFEAVDALETHYHGGSQPREFADKALDSMLALVGIDPKQVTWGASEYEVVAAPDATKGYIVTQDTDGKFQRPVAFVFAGKPAHKDGSKVTLTPALVRKSVNYKLLEAGLAFPTFYTTMTDAMVLNEMTNAAVTANSPPALGIWPSNFTMKGVALGFEAIEQEYIILPKLFRRMYDFLKTGKPKSQFRKWLAEKKSKVILRATKEVMPLEDVISQKGSKVKLLVQPEELLFYP